MTNTSELPAELMTRIAALQQLDRDGLRTEWQRIYGTRLPRFYRDLIILALAYRLQETALGGLKPSALRLLRKVVEDGQAGLTPLQQTRPGTVLIREWQGATHHVQVVEDGVLYRDQRYRSLTQVAQLITGAHWSGPRFFGLVRGDQAA